MALNGWFRSERFASLCEQILISGANFTVAVIAARVLAREEWGLFSLAFATVVFLQGFQRAFVVLPMISYSALPERFAGHYNHWAKSNNHLAFLSLLALASLVVAGMLVKSDWIVESAMAAGVMVVPAFFLEYQRRALVQVRASAYLPVPASLYAVVVVSGLILSVNLSPSALALAAANAVAASVAGALIWSRVRSRIDLSSNVRLEESTLSFSAWSSLAHVGFAGYNYAVQLILGHFHGPAAIGVMNATRNLVQPVQTFVGAMDNVDKPRASRSYAQGGIGAMVGSLAGSARVLIGVGGLYLLVMFLGGAAFLELAYADKYLENVPELRIWLVVFAAILLTQPAESGLYVLRRPETLCVGRCIAACIAVTIAYYLVPVGGATAAVGAIAAGWLVAGFLAGGFLIFHIWRSKRQS